jgi:hypothetical protein
MKMNTYIIDATDTEGETVLDGYRIRAMTDKAAWAEGLKQAFLRISAQSRRGFLVGRLLKMEVTRL